MIGISLSSDQIRTAPAEVRRWIEREVMTSLGLQAAPADSRPQGEHLAACSEEQAAAVLSQIQGVLPAVNVLFEFGRQGAIFGQAGSEAFRLVDDPTGESSYFRLSTRAVTQVERTDHIEHIADRVRNAGHMQRLRVDPLQFSFA